MAFIFPLIQEQLDFIEIQRINLQRLTEGYNFELTAIEEAKILQIAEKGRPLDGYARGVWVAIFGEHLSINLPVIGSGENLFISAINNQTSPKIKTGPNPVRNIYTINLVENKLPTEVSVWNVQGQEVLKDNFKKNALNYQFNTESFQKGIYFLTITNREGIVYQTKFIKS